jgi:hypothetical protein
MAAINQWTKPRPVYGGELSTYAFWNTFCRDNFTWLKTRPFTKSATGIVNTTSTTFVEMTSSSVAITTTGGYLLFWAIGGQSNSAGSLNTYDLAVDGIRQGHATFGTTLMQGLLSNYNDNLNLMMITGGGVGGSLLAAGAHTCSIHWKVGSGTGGASLQLFVVEIA